MTSQKTDRQRLRCVYYVSEYTGGPYPTAPPFTLPQRPATVQNHHAKVFMGGANRLPSADTPAHLPLIL